VNSTRFAAISDIHGNLNALQAVLADVGREGVDTIINVLTYSASHRRLQKRLIC
jgi:predicted phosphodiesterase